MDRARHPGHPPGGRYRDRAGRAPGDPRLDGAGAPDRRRRRGPPRPTATTVTRRCTPGRSSSSATGWTTGLRRRIPGARHPGGLTGQPVCGWGHNTFGRAREVVLGRATPHATDGAAEHRGRPDGHRPRLRWRTARSRVGYDLDGALGDGSTSQRAARASLRHRRGGRAGRRRSPRTAAVPPPRARTPRQSPGAARFNRQLGNGSTVSSRNVPGLVLTAANTADRCAGRGVRGGRRLCVDGRRHGEGVSWPAPAPHRRQALRRERSPGSPTSGRSAGSSMVFFVRTDGTVSEAPILGRVAGNVGTPTSALPAQPGEQPGSRRQGGRRVERRRSGGRAEGMAQVFMWRKSTT